MNRTSHILMASLLVAISCKPDFALRDSLVQDEQVLALQGEPAEAKPGEAVSYSVLVASPSGTVTNAPLLWAFCATPTSLTENDSVSPTCLTDDGVRPIGGPAPSLSAPTPGDSCSLFGPDTPPGQVRPRDPDVTGGYFQPIRTRVGSITAFGFERVLCDLPNAPAAVTLQFNQQYVANQNPAPPTIAVSMNGSQAAFGNLSVGSHIDFRASWSASDAESYVIFDTTSESIVPARESMRVSWFATDGSFDADRTGRDDTDTTTYTDNGWSAPSNPGVVHLWVVLRDSRGGVSFVSQDLTVK